MSQTLIRSLKSQNAALQGEIERLAIGIDNLSQQLADALNLLKPHHPEFVASIVGEDTGEKVPVVINDGDPEDDA